MTNDVSTYRIVSVYHYLHMRSRKPMTQLETFESKYKTSRAETIYNYDLSTRSQLTCTRTATLPSSLPTFVNSSARVRSFGYFIAFHICTLNSCLSLIAWQSIYTHLRVQRKIFFFRKTNATKKYLFPFARGTHSCSFTNRTNLFTTKNRIVF